jgi:hypothetical protein
MKRRPTHKDGFLSYDAAKAFIRDLKISTSIAYKLWAYSAKRPPQIPVAPESVYNGSWKGWDDYLSRDPKRAQSKRRPPKGNEFMAFGNAKEHAQRLQLKTVNDFKMWAASHKRPCDFPSNPDLFYKEQWKGYRDFLGIQKPTFMKFEELRSYIQAFGLKNEAEYRLWAVGKDRPDTAPSNPDKYYSEDWSGWKDFLGTRKN